MVSQVFDILALSVITTYHIFYYCRLNCFWGFVIYLLMLKLVDIYQINFTGMIRILFLTKQ